MVSPVNNQCLCGSCYAFSATILMQTWVDEQQISRSWALETPVAFACLPFPSSDHPSFPNIFIVRIFTFLLDFFRQLSQRYLSLNALVFNDIFFDMRKQLVVAALATIALLVFYNSAEQKGDAFEEWKSQHGVSWAPEEEAYRRLIFEKNLLDIERHNADPSQTYKKGVNQFTVFTQQEFSHLFLKSMLHRQSSVSHFDEAQELKGSKGNDIDWVAKGKVSRVKNQGSCGSCYAFAATGVMESWALINGKEVDLSEQQIVDCTKFKGNFGCKLGFTQNALDYVKINGIISQQAYPYVAKEQNCTKEGGDFKIQGYSRYRDCESIEKGIYSGPMAVTVDATNWGPYNSGVFTNCRNSSNHDALLVGILDGNYKVKNQWGTAWGQSGFITLKGPGSTCGICISSISIK